MCKDNETHNCENNNTDHSGKDETSSDQEQNTQKGGLPQNLDYNSITNFFLNILNINKNHKVINYIPLVVSIVLGILPLIDQDILKCFQSNIIQILVVAGIVLVIYPYIRQFFKCNKNAITTSELFGELKDDQIEFLSDEKILDDMIDYLRKSDKGIENLMYKIIGLSVTLYTAYSNIDFISDKFLLLCYVGVIIGYAILGLTAISRSNERLYFLNLLEHIKVKKIKNGIKNK